MPRRREFGLFHISINGDLHMVFKGSVGEINRWSKGKGWTFRRDSRNIFGGYWVDDATGDSYGADIIGGRKGQARNPTTGTMSEADRNWWEYWQDHASTAAKIYKSIRKRHPDSDEEMIEEETANVLMGLHDSPIRTATFDEDIAADLAWVARHTVERPEEFLTENPVGDAEFNILMLDPNRRVGAGGRELKVIETVTADASMSEEEVRKDLTRNHGYPPEIVVQRKKAKNPIGDPQSVLEFAQDIMARKRSEGPGVYGKFALAESGLGVAITSAQKIGARRIKYVDITPAGTKFQVTGYAGSDARLQLLGYPKAIHTSDANEAANYLSSIYAIRHAPGTRR